MARADKIGRGHIEAQNLLKAEFLEDKSQSTSGDGCRFFYRCDDFHLGLRNQPPRFDYTYVPEECLA
jgi:hypothetical protein